MSDVWVCQCVSICKNYVEILFMLCCVLSGVVIGRGGEMITRLQAESGARIQVAPGM